MAKGMRASFAPQRSLVLPAMLEKCKERKAQMIQALRDALDAMFLCLSGLSDIVEDFVTAAKSKNPQVRQETVIWLTRCLSIAKKAPGKTDIKAITEALTKVGSGFAC